MENKDNIASIQMLRAIAALFVVSMHEQFYFSDYAKLVHVPLPAMSSWYNFMTIGGMGVDLFFVISGFIMAYLAAKNPKQTLRGFFWRRITRIVPLYWLVTSFWLWFDPHHPANYIIRSFFFIPVKNVFPLTGVGWTLNMEMFFYLVFGLIVIGLRRSFLWIAPIFLLLTIAGQFSSNYILKFYADPLIWCFFIGIVIQRIYRHKIALYSAPVFVVLGVGGLVYALLTFAAPSAWAAETVIRWGIPCAMLTLGYASLEAGKKWNAVWRIRLFQALGAASYSIYLIHPVGFARINFYLLMDCSAVNRVGPDGAVILLICAAACAGYLVHLLIELPSIEILRASRALVAKVAYMNPD